jgi:hypothetical protein
MKLTGRQQSRNGRRKDLPGQAATNRRGVPQGTRRKAGLEVHDTLIHQLNVLFYV